MHGDWHEFCVDAWMNQKYTSDMMNEQMHIWNIWVNGMFPMQCIAYMTPVYCWKRICVTMHGHWQEFCWDAWMNWVYSSDTINKSNANQEYMGQLHVSNAMQCITYMTPVYCWKHICVTMRGHWQEFRWDAWMNWVYSSDTVNESNANLEYMGQLHVSDAMHRIYVTCKVLKLYIC